VTFRRARSEDCKKIRITEILSAAESVIAEQRFERCNLNDIAAAVGMSKPALYRYFRVKELIFLEIYRRELSELIPLLIKAFTPPSSEAITKVFVSRPIFCRLSGILTTVLEQPLTLEEAIDFKSEVAILMQPLVKTVAIELSLTPQNAIQCILQLFSSLIGAWHLSNPSALMAKAYEIPELSVFNMKFYDSLYWHIEALLKGYVD